MPASIDPAVGLATDACRSRRRGATAPATSRSLHLQQAVHPLDEPAGTEGLRDVVVGARLVALLLVDVAALRRKQDHRRSGPGSCP